MSIGLRKKPRVKMVVPVRLWGTDSAGNPFNVLAHTLNVSSTGARIGGVRVALSVGEAVTVQYKQVRALFKVVWIGRPGDRTEQQIGVHLLEQDRQVWAELSEPESYRDDFSGKRRELPPAQLATAEAATAVSAKAASPAVPVEEVEAAQDAPPPKTPLPPPDPALKVLASEDDFSDTNSLIRSCARGLLHLERAVKDRPPEAAALQEFRQALGKVRQTVWALQQWYEAKSESDKGFPLLSYLNTERLRFVIQATHDLAEDIANKGVEVDAALLESLFEGVNRLRSAKGPVEEFQVEVVGPAATQQPESAIVSQLRAALTDAKRSGMSSTETLQFLARELLRTFSADGVALARLDGAEMVCEASAGNAAEPGMLLEIDSGIGAEAVNNLELVYCRDTQSDSRVDAELCRSANIGAVVMLPITTASRALVGLMEISAARPNPFGEDQLQSIRDAALFIAPLVAPQGAAV